MACAVQYDSHDYFEEAISLIRCCVVDEPLVETALSAATASRKHRNVLALAFSWQHMLLFLGGQMCQFLSLDSATCSVRVSCRAVVTMLPVGLQVVGGGSRPASNPGPATPALF
jgi:hypothetical protein